MGSLHIPSSERSPILEFSDNYKIKDRVSNLDIVRQVTENKSIDTSCATGAECQPRQSFSDYSLYPDRFDRQHQRTSGVRIELKKTTNNARFLKVTVPKGKRQPMDDVNSAIDLAVDDNLDKFISSSSDKDKEVTDSSTDSESGDRGEKTQEEDNKEAKIDKSRSRYYYFDFSMFPDHDPSYQNMKNMQKPVT